MFICFIHFYTLVYIIIHVSYIYRHSYNLSICLYIIIQFCSYLYFNSYGENFFPFINVASSDTKNKIEAVMAGEDHGLHRACFRCTEEPTKIWVFRLLIFNKPVILHRIVKIFKTTTKVAHASVARTELPERISAYQCATT